MKNKQRLIANISFILINFIILIVCLLNWVDFKIGIPLMLICIGCQQLFIGLRFYKENKELRIQHILVSIVSFVFTLLIVLKIHHLA